MGNVTPMRRGQAKPANDVEELSLEDLELDDLDLEDVDLENEPEVEEPAKKAPAKPKAAPKPKAKAAPKAEEPEEVELDFEDEAEEAPEQLSQVGKKTRTYTRKTAHDVVTEGTDMTAFLRGFAAGKFGVNLSDEDAFRVQATLEAAEQDHTGRLFAHLIGADADEAPGLLAHPAKVKAAPKAKAAPVAKAAPAKASKAVAKTKAAVPAGKAEVGSMEHKRAWLRKNGYPNLGDRGRLPSEGVAAYEAAH